MIGFLRSRGQKAYVIAPEWLQRRVLQPNTATPAENLATWSQNATPRVEIRGDRLNFIVVAEDAAQEEALLRSLSTRKGDKAYGLFRHVLPALLCGVNGLAARQSAHDLTRYAIICVPRSGSRYLAAVLSNRGIGAPKEHIRETLANVISEGKLGFGPAITALEKFGQSNHIFGTKLISTFVIKASNRRLPELEANIAWMVERGYRFVRLERSLNEAVVSSYIAFLMRKWHFFGELDEESRKRLDSLVFENGAAWEEYIRFRAEQVVVDSVAIAHDIPTIRYSEIESGIDDVVQRICGLIQVDREQLVPGSARIPVVTRSESPTYSIFAERLESLLHEKRDELEARTVKKIRTMTSLNSRRVEKLVADASARMADSR